MNNPADASWYEATARQRIAGLVDRGSFGEYCGPEHRETSPHLALFDLPVQLDDGMIVGSARLDGRRVLVAAQEGRFMGGAIGEVHGAKLTGLLRAAAALARPVLLLLDTGGVRLQEANAGEVAVAEILRALIEARQAGAAVIALVGGRGGCFGGGGLIAGCCSAIVVSEKGRIGVTGPEVVEINRGVEEYDSRDRPFVWRTTGGKHRYLIGGADRFVADDARAFRAAALTLVDRDPRLSLERLGAEQARLARRIARFAATDAQIVWRAMGVPDPAAIPDLDTDAFVAIADRHREAADDAR